MLNLRILVVLVLCSASATAADPRPAPSRLVPATGLDLYIEYDGLGAHADAWKATAAYGMLHETTAGMVMSSVAERGLGVLLKKVRDSTLTGADLVALHEHVAHHGFAFAHYDDADAPSTVLVLHGLAGKEVRARFDRFLRFLLSIEPGASLPGPKGFRGRALHETRRIAGNNPGLGGSTTPRTWWLEGDALIVVRGPADDPAHEARVAAVLDTIDAERPGAESHPALPAALAEGGDLAGFEASGFFFAQSAAGKGVLGDLADAMKSAAADVDDALTESDLLDALDLSRSERIVGRWGFRGKALVTDVRFAVSPPRKALLGMLRPSGFPRDRLPPVPRGRGALAVGAFDNVKIGKLPAPLGKGMKPGTLKVLEAVEQLMSVGPLRGAADEVLRHVGPTWCVCASPPGNGSSPDSTVSTFVVQVDDADAVDKALGALAACVNAAIRDLERTGNDAPAAMVLERLPAPDRGYRLSSPAGAVAWLDGVQPTIVLGKTHAAIAGNLVLARAAIAAESRPAEPPDELAASLAGLPANLAFLIVGNPRDSSWPEAIASLPRKGVPFLVRFAGGTPDDEDLSRPASGLLGQLGVARPRARRGISDPPSADALAAYLFPSITAATIDENSVRLIRLEAIPFACLGINARYGPGDGPRPLTLKVDFRPGK